MLWIFAAIFAPVAARAQADSVGGVHGQVLDARSGLPIVRAVVTVVTPSRTALTDDDGRFAIDGLAPHQLTLRVRALGFSPVERRVVIPRGGVVPLELRLEPIARQLAEVRTEARAREREQFETTPDVGALSVTSRALQAVPGIGEPDILRAVQTLPGVLARNDYTAGYNVRGGEADQNLVLMDGIPIYNPFHLGGLFSTFIDATVGGVTLQTGGFPAPYGGRLSSVLDVESAEEGRQGLHGEAAVSLLSSSLALGSATGSGKTSWNIGGRRTYADAVTGALTSRTFPYHFDDLQLHVRHEFARSTLTVTAFTGRDVLDGSFANLGQDANPGGGDFSFDWGNRLVGATWRQSLSLGDSTIHTEALSYTRFATALNLGRGSLTFTNSVAESRASGSLAWYSGAHAHRAGYELSSHSVRYDVGAPQLATEFFALRQNPTAGSVYYDETWRTGRLLMRGGARAEHVTGTDWTGVSPRASVKYFATPSLAFTLAGGQYAQWMHALRREDIPIRVFDFWIASDRGIDVSTARHFVGGVEHWVSDARFVRLEGYVKQYTNLSETNPADDPDVRGDEFRRLGGTSYGLDLLLRQLESEALNGWVAYSYGVSSREAPGPNGPERFFPAQDRRHNLNVLAAYRMGPRYELGARFAFGSGLPYTPIVGELVRRTYGGGVNPWDAGITRREIEPVGGNRNSARYPPFHRLDVSITRTMTRGRATYAPYLSVINVYNRKNVFIYTFDYTGNPPTTSAISQFPLLPTIGMTVHF